MMRASVKRHFFESLIYQALERRGFEAIGKVGFH